MTRLPWCSSGRAAPCTSTNCPAVKWLARSSVPTGSRASGVTWNSASLRLLSTPAAAKWPLCLCSSSGWPQHGMLQTLSSHLHRSVTACMVLQLCMCYALQEPRQELRQDAGGLSGTDMTMQGAQKSPYVPSSCLSRFAPQPSCRAENPSFSCPLTCTTCKNVQLMMLQRCLLTAVCSTDGATPSPT